MHNRLVPKERYPFPGRRSILLGATAQDRLAIAESDEFGLAKPGNDLALILELEEKLHERFL